MTKSQHIGCRASTYRFINTTVPNAPSCVSNVIAQYARNAHQLLTNAGTSASKAPPSSSTPPIPTPKIKNPPPSSNTPRPALPCTTQPPIPKPRRHPRLSLLHPEHQRPIRTRGIRTGRCLLLPAPSPFFEAAKLLSHAANIASATIDITEQQTQPEQCPHCGSKPRPLSSNPKEDIKQHTRAPLPSSPKPSNISLTMNFIPTPQSLHLNALNAAIKPSP